MRRFLLGLGLTVVTVAAVVASFSTLASLAVFTGWGVRSSWLLPASLDALGMTACLVWLDVSASAKSRRYAAWLTWTAAGLSILGNGAGHLASTGHLAQGLLLVVLVGAVPPAALATTVHLIVLVSSSDPTLVVVPDAAPVPVETQVEGPDLTSSTSTSGPGSTSGQTSSPTSGQVAGRTSPKRQVGTRSKPKVEPRSEAKVDEVELQRARHADRAYQTENAGQPITRDALKKALKCGTDKASALLAALEKEREAA